jgi:hypothetical protein
MRVLFLHVTRLLILVDRLFYSYHRLYIFQSGIGTVRIIVINSLLQEEGI